MKKRSFAGRVLRGIYSYVLFFLMVAFLVTCTTSLFVSVLSYSLGIELTNENLQLAAKITFDGVAVLTGKPFTAALLVIEAATILLLVFCTYSTPYKTIFRHN